MNIDDRAKETRNELVSRLIALTFLKLKNDFPTLGMESIRPVVKSTLVNSLTTKGSSFDVMSQQAIDYVMSNGDDVNTGVTQYLNENAYGHEAILELADAIAPLVVQTVGKLQSFRTEASNLLHDLQETIVTRIAQDESLKTYNIIPVSMGILNDVNELPTTMNLAESEIPKPELNYSVESYRAFARDKKYNTLNNQEIAILKEFLSENNLQGKELERHLSNEFINPVFMPEVVENPKAYADQLTDMWEKGIILKDIVDKLPDESSLPSRIRENITNYLPRVAMGIYWANLTVNGRNKNVLINGHDKDNIYVYPWTYNKFAEDNGQEIAEKKINDFVIAKDLTGFQTPSNGWSVSDVNFNVNFSEESIKRYREGRLLNQKNQTVSVIRGTVAQSLKERGIKQDWSLKIQDDLENNKETTLQDISTAIVCSTENYYLKTFYDATISEEASSADPNVAKANVILKFLANVAKDRVVSV